jgi:hypothetical protein
VPPSPKEEEGGGGCAPALPGTAEARGSDFYGRDPTAVTIDDAIAGLVDKMQRLDDLIADRQGDGDALLRVYEVYAQASSRLSRLLRDRRALSGEAADGFAGAIGQVLDELATELKTEL